MKAPQRKTAIAGVRALDRPVQAHFQRILEQFTKKSAPKSPEQQKSEKPKPKPVPQEDTKQKTDQLKAELAALKEKEEKMEADLKAQKESKSIADKAHEKITQLVNEEREKLKEADREYIQLKAQLREKEDRIEQLRSEMKEFEEQDTKLAKAVKSKVHGSNSSDLQSELESLKKQICEGDASSVADDVESIIKYIDETLSQKREEVSVLENQIQEATLARDMKKSDADAINNELQKATEKAIDVMLRKLTELKMEVNKSQLGVAMKKNNKYRKAREMLEKDIKVLKEENEETEILRAEVGAMAMRKSNELTMLAKKQAHVESTLAQCNLRMQRLKLHIDLQTHENRLTRWKNCFE